MDEAYERNLYENTLQQEDFPSRCLFSDVERATARGSGPEACVITGGTPGQTRTDGARSGSSGRTASPVGLHRVIEPAGGIDAILNVKGHAGEKGLESYREMRVVNLGAQVAVGDLVARARARVVCRADPESGPSASQVLEPPVTVVTARGTVVVPVANKDSVAAG